jgi:hypothetical protein
MEACISDRVSTPQEIIGLLNSSIGGFDVDIISTEVGVIIGLLILIAFELAGIKGHLKGDD